MDAARQAYLYGFEGGDLRPDRARMVEAFVNGVDGQAVDNLTLCKIGGYSTSSIDVSRNRVWKIFTSRDDKHVAEYRAEREYVRFLQAKNMERSAWDAETIRQRLQRNVMLAQGEIEYDKIFTASHQGAITVKVLRVAEINIPAATAALQLLGKNIGMFVDRVEIKDSFGELSEAELEAELEMLRGESGEKGAVTGGDSATTSVAGAESGSAPEV